MSTRVEPPPPAAAPASVEPAVAPAPGRPRFPLIDGVRAIAALGVLFTHTAALSGFNENNVIGAWTARMDSGVAIFFVLSGFLLYRPFVAARLEGGPAPRPLRYALHRAARILPAYWVALTVMGLVLSAQVPLVFSSDWWIYYGLLQSWQPDSILYGIGVAWSLSVEVAFYVLLPGLAYLVGRRLRGRPAAAQVRVELTLLAVSAVVAVAGRLAFELIAPDYVYGNTLPGMWAWFTGGMSLAVLSAAYGARPLAERPALVRSATERPVAWWLAAFALLTVTAWCLGLPRNLLTPYTTFNLTVEHVLYGLMAVCLVAPAAFADGRRSAVARLLGSRVVAWLGLVSYGIFLYHLPLATRLLSIGDYLPGGILTYVAATLVAATACAAASYYLVERPLLARVKRRR